MMGLITTLQKYDREYFETGKPLVSDAKYDKLKEQAREKFPNHKYFKAVGHRDETGTKRKLPVRCGSLDKITPDDVPGWVKSKACDYYALGPKLDGLSGLLHYRYGKLHRAFTRGDGITGRLVTSTAQHVQGVVKNLKGKGHPRDIYVRGEFIIHNRLFNKFYSKTRREVRIQGVDYSNPRNFCVGMINRKDLKPKHIKALNHMTFIGYALYAQEDKDILHKKSKHIEWLTISQFGLTPITIPTRYTQGHRDLVKGVKSGKWASVKGMLPVLDYSKILTPMIVAANRLTPEFVKAQLKYFENETDILLDGLVIEVNEWKKAKKFGYEANGLNPKWGRSIKLDVTEQKSQIGTIKKVEWSMSRRRLMKPVIILKTPLDFNGVKVTRLSGYNAKFIVDNGLRRGIKVEVIRSGDVIPRLMKVYHDKWISVP